ncbi:POK18 protein, partial [Phainopepla nitens]|nr:POK18 protein [Phainopepla nitens]
WKYLGWTISDSQVRPQKLTIQQRLSTLHDVQRFMGDIQWLRPVVGITNDDLEKLKPLLRGMDPAAP